MTFTDTAIVGENGLQMLAVIFWGKQLMEASRPLLEVKEAQGLSDPRVRWHLLPGLRTDSHVGNGAWLPHQQSPCGPGTHPPDGLLVSR